MLGFIGLVYCSLAEIGGESGSGRGRWERGQRGVGRRVGNGEWGSEKRRWKEGGDGR